MKFLIESYREMGPRRFFKNCFHGFLLASPCWLIVIHYEYLLWMKG